MLANGKCCFRWPAHVQGARKAVNTCTREEGNTLVETAVVMPVFLLLIFGFINFALIMFGLCNLSYATRYAARYACLHSSTSLLPVTTSTITTLINPYIFQYPANTYTSGLAYSGVNVIGGQATVTLTVTYTLNLPFIPASALTFTTHATGVITQ